MRRECVGRDHPCARRPPPAARRPPPAARRPPFGVIIVTATLVGFDHSRTPAARNPSASPLYAFRAATIPPLWCGRAFSPAPAFDEAVTALFLGDVELRTVPGQMWSGVREQLSPTILAVATVLILISVALLFTLEFLRRRNARMRGLAD